MIGCLIVESSEHLYPMINLIINEQFKYNEFEVKEGEEIITVYTWNTDRIPIWQAALLLEIAYIKVGYGFHEYKDIARELAEGLFDYRQSLEWH